MIKFTNDYFCLVLCLVVVSQLKVTFFFILIGPFIGQRKDLRVSSPDKGPCGPSSRQALHEA